MILTGSQVKSVARDKYRRKFRTHEMGLKYRKRLIFRKEKQINKSEYYMKNCK